jgi:hypothetical protein
MPDPNTTQAMTAACAATEKAIPARLRNCGPIIPDQRLNADTPPA